MKIPLATAAVASSSSSLIGTDADRAFILALLGMGLLVFYRMKRKFKKEGIKTWKAWADHNIVEIGLISVITPSTSRMVVDLIRPILDNF